MSLKKEFIILGVIAVGLLVYLLLRQSDRTQYELPTVPKIERENVTRIEISQQARQIELSKDNGQWRLLPSGYPVDETKITSVLETLEKFSLTALASDSGNYDTYDLGKDKRIDVTVYQGEKAVLVFAIGKAAPSFRHTFVTVSADDRVFHAQDNFRARFDPDAESWRDKTVMRFEQGTIYQIALSGPDFELSARKTQTPVNVGGEPTESTTTEPPVAETVMRWETSAGQLLDDAQVDSWMTALSTLKCDSFVEGKSKDDFTTPIYTVQLVGNSEQRLTLFEPIGEEGKYPAVSAASDYPFFLPKWRAEQIMKKPADLIKTENATE